MLLHIKGFMPYRVYEGDQPVLALLAPAASMHAKIVAFDPGFRDLFFRARGFECCKRTLEDVPSAGFGHVFSMA